MIMHVIINSKDPLMSVNLEFLKHPMGPFYEYLNINSKKMN